MPIVEDRTRSFATALAEELVSIESARQEKELYPPDPVVGGAVGPIVHHADAAPHGVRGRVARSLRRGIAFVRNLVVGQKPPEAGEPPYAEALSRDLVGVSISGGGIRSATLSLGILQGMAAKGLIRHIDYLSTVSGGGYIGSWLIAWMRRIAGPTVSAKAALDHVESTMIPDWPDPDNEDREPIHQLRRYSNYLTPDISFLQADTWTLAAIWTRNTILNLSIIVFGIAVLLLVPRFAVLVRHLISPETLLSADSHLAGILLVIAALVIGFNLLMVGRGEARGAGQSGVQAFIVVPAILAAAAITEWMLRRPDLFVKDWLLIPSIVAGVLYLIVAWTAGFPGCFVAQNRRSLPGWMLWLLGYVLAIFASALAGLLTAAFMHGLALLLQTIPASWEKWAAFCLGPPMVLWVLSLGMTLQIGLMGHDLPDASREWLGRLRAWTLIYSGGWLLLTGISIYGPYALYWAGSTTSISLGAVWSAITATGLFAGASEKTAGAGSAGIDWKGLCLEAVTKLAPYVFMLGFATLIAFGIHELVSPKAVVGAAQTQARSITLSGTPEPVTLTVGEKPKPAGHFEARREAYPNDLTNAAIGYWSVSNIDFFNLGSLFLLAAVGGMILSWRVDINDFSMHHFYKNRLVRCYLGASRRDRRPDPFTGFDDRDDIPLAEFAGQQYCGPYPIINGALNLAGGTALAWQERKAASFVFTPRNCGYNKPQIDKESNNPKKTGPFLSENGYTPTGTFAYEQGIKIGTAMGISGAAANPNAGYHTSPAVAFLLTIFNVRLGWWLGNPARLGKEDNPGPAFGLTYLITELFGLASSDKAYVNVSDGGHFENLGIYELVRRRCRYIITCDGEQDGDLKFEGLASAIRKCRTDFGVGIDIDADQIRLKNGFSHAHCVVGRIRYPHDDRPAYLLYLKSSLTGNEDTDVLQYRSTHPEFPHQSTADQWFDESQFESYRKLGVHIVDSAFGVGGRPLEDRYTSSWSYRKAKGELFQALWEKLYPPSDAIQKSFTKHADDYTKLVDEIAKGANTTYLDGTIFSKWAASLPAAPNTREGRYRCISFLQLVENVYLDLQLDDPIQRDHPHNAGWLTLFRQWAVSDAFRDAWTIAEQTYGKRFQEFYKGLIDQESGRIEGTWTATVAPGAVVPGLQEIILFVDYKKHAIRGMADTATSSLEILDARFNGTDLTFTLVIPPVPPAPAVPLLCRLRPEDGDRVAILTPAAGVAPTTTLERA